MNNDQIRTKLQTMLTELQNRRDRVARHTRHRDEPLPSDFAEQAVELENGETLVALDREMSEEIKQIEQALRRLDAGTYDECASCGEPIGEERLKALPYASQCIDCAG
ncbi:MAG: TraR/DksA family transcriptional regulator [Pseudomonadales bacterium]